jgi:hypothetical protein
LVTQYRKELRKAFAAKAVVRKGRPVLDVEPFGANPNDGTFLMNFYDFCEFYTNIFAVVDVSTWKTQKYQCSWKVSDVPLGFTPMFRCVRRILCVFVWGNAGCKWKSAAVVAIHRW